jgi:integrase
MASISKESNGRRTIQFVAADGKRRSIRLGKITQRMAEGIKVRIEHLANAVATGQPLEPETALWLEERDSELLDKLAAVGLIPKRQVASLGWFIDQYIASRVDVKPGTKEVWRQGKLGLIGFFGSDRAVRTITAGDAENYKMSMIGQKLAPMTVRKRLQFAKTVFRSMVKHRLLSSSPFADVKGSATMDPARQHFISREDTAKILKSCPNWEWRTIVALARYGGLRCPSEVLSLRFQDIDWEAGRIRVTSPKTEHHAGKGSRLIPLFPELRPWLAEALELAPDRSNFILDRFRARAMGPTGWRNCNLRTTFEKIVLRSGLSVWPRLFHNLRASRETELAKEYPIHVVTSWLGNTPRIALKHYLQVTEQRFQTALESSAEAVQNPVQKALEHTGNEQNGELTPESENGETPEEFESFQELATTFMGNQVSPEAYTTDGEGFEPPVGFRPLRFSRPPQ